MKPISKPVETVTDATAVTIGVGATGQYIFELFDKIVNPVLAGVIALLTAVWLVYRIIEIRQNIKSK